MLADPGFWESLAGGYVQACQATSTADGVAVALTVKAPAEAKRVTGDTIEATLAASWQADCESWAGPLTLRVKGLPASFDGSSTVSPDGDGTKVVYTGDLSIKLPLVGPSLEAKAAPFLMGVINAQEAAGARWLASH